MKFSIAPEPKNGLPLALIAGLTAVILIAVSFTGLAQSASAAPSKRIVALSPFAAKTMSNLGVKPVAMGETLGGDYRGSSLETVKKLPLSHPNGPNLEQLAKLRPDLVFTSPQWAKGTSAMKQLGIKVVTSEPMSIAQIYSQTTKIARIVGKQKKAKRLVRQMRSKVGRATKGAVTAEHPKVLLVLGVGRTPFTFLENSWGGKLMKAAGGDLQTGGASQAGGFARISDEVILAAQPDVIIAVPHANTVDIPKAIQFLETNPAWEGTPAKDAGRIYVSTDNSLLQAGTDPYKVIDKIRRTYLKNR